MREPVSSSPRYEHAVLSNIDSGIGQVIDVPWEDELISDVFNHLPRPLRNALHRVFGSNENMVPPPVPSVNGVVKK